MELTLEAIALFALKLAYETEGASPILRDDQLMAEYEREVFGLLVRAADVKAIQLKVDAPPELGVEDSGRRRYRTRARATAAGRRRSSGTNDGSTERSTWPAQGLPERHSMKAFQTQGLPHDRLQQQRLLQAQAEP
jgi:hypothetical protein